MRQKKYDDNLEFFEKEGIPELPEPQEVGYVKNKGAMIFYQTFGVGFPILMIHGGLGHGGNWGYQVPELVTAGYQVVLIDSRGHGHSTRDNQPYSYELMTNDVFTVLDTLNINKVAFVGWSDGAIISLIAAIQQPERVAGVFYFGCNMDPSGTKEIEFTSILSKVFSYHTKQYNSLSSTPGQFAPFADAVDEMMKTQPNYSAGQLGQISVPVKVVQSEKDEFIKMEHAQYIADTIPDAELLVLGEVSHFAPWQRPELFTTEILNFLSTLDLF